MTSRQQLIKGCANVLNRYYHKWHNLQDWQKVLAAKAIVQEISVSREDWQTYYYGLSLYGHGRLINAVIQTTNELNWPTFTPKA